MKKAQWWIATITATVVVGATAGTAVIVNERNKLYYDAPTHANPLENPKVIPISALSDSTYDPAKLRLVDRFLNDPRLGTASFKVRNTATGDVVVDKNAALALKPASTAKMLTAAAALIALGPEKTISTSVVAQDQHTAVIKGAGDVSLRAADLDEMAQAITSQLPEVRAILVDNSAFRAPEFMPGWDPRDIDGGFVAPIQSVMINEGRLGAESGYVPRSHTPALDVAQEVAARVGVDTFGLTTLTNVDTLPEIFRHESAPLEQRLERMMEDSDNVMAEAIAREIDPVRPVEKTQEVLAPYFNLDGIRLVDNSGLSVDNRIPSALLEDIVFRAATDLEQLRPLLSTLPVAGGTGTLATRYENLAGRGWVRAKTGTLDHVASLAGIVQGASNTVYSFAIIGNDIDVLEGRLAMDELLSDLRAQG
ncbi:D-alanyl-D-alanine carboxypeptidase/D-alanyl-D-alanine-endopeptidase [Corynebacterium sp. ES2794-CONJ1]|uniref:D-alanyl-D-alanine carboxypeptidase/D-alanyl-D-alanine endopeptidase n=1 Tax=unclassified Corynebacterium TaxID=2624378 RepID=UPI00216AFA91|nr:MULTISPECIES: D-alanyl-D-alanine carboxypeptidase/D-alanyl-D-alanine-endopeptidase [unclassified Corynebacterium]MCS4532057.1 D-alanyl-D-alanine carboxypeptidase/D-alanyl-D-alanine-endopeptidase [Corynebacterium sp. ES2730-CONJ]MCU9519458.1 D-alanyl-D-alanine carboxypeptidase/D-alanyl-D-alanine-endopeptidase [Corynebacterium sp. ES2794-CONJ1]